MGNVSSIDRFKRLEAIKKLSEDGKTDQEIADLTGISIMAVKRNQTYLKNLQLSDLTPEQVAEKRSEIYLELIEAGDKAKDLHDKYEQTGDLKKLTQAKGYYHIWLKTLEMRAMLYGLNSIKIPPAIQVNNQYNSYESEKVDNLTAVKIADALKKSHEDKLAEKFKQKEEVE